MTENSHRWRERVRFAVQIAETERALDLMLGRGVSPAFERARQGVIDAIDAALLAGATEADVDAVLAADDGLAGVVGAAE